MTDVAERGSDFIKDLGDAARRNPISAALIGMGIVWLFAAVSTASGQSFVVPLPDFTVTGSGVINSPTLTTVNSLSPVPALSNILGFSVQANWAAGNPPAGDPSATFSQEFQASIAPAGVATSPLGYLAGRPDSNPGESRRAIPLKLFVTVLPVIRIGAAALTAPELRSWIPAFHSHPCSWPPP
jgi:hypothetical protein